MKFKQNKSGTVFDTANPMYSSGSLVESVANVFANPNYHVSSVTVEEEGRGTSIQYTRLPDVRVVYEIRACVPGTYRPIGKWTEVTEDEYRSSLGNLYFQCRDRKVEQ